MQTDEYIIIFIKKEINNVYHVGLKPKKSKYIIQFKPGQFFHIKNPMYKPLETHPFSAITTPKTTTHIEFCIKECGDWTKSFLAQKIGDSVWLYGPMGNFTMDESISYPIFIAGGVGITPILSIAQSLQEENQPHPVTLIYATKSPQTIIKNKTIEDIFYKKNNWKTVFIFSQEKNKMMLNSYSGHITTKILRKELNLKKKLTFFVCGTQLFNTNIIKLLHECSIDASQIKKEIFSI